jgi:lysophospholipase L1-like esterase
MRRGAAIGPTRRSTSVILLPGRASARLLRRTAPWISATAAVALAVPIVQAVVMWRTIQPAIPGPHDLDGEIPGWGSPEDPMTVVWLGDSLACGMGAGSADAAFPRRAVARWTADDGRPVTLRCLARAGSTSGDVLAEQVPAAVGLLGPGAVAVLTVGSNDVGSCIGPRRFARDYGAILRSLRATGAEVIAVGLPDLGSAVVIPHPLRALARGVGRRADRAVRTMALRHGAHHVSIDNRAPWRTEPGTYLAADRYHPNDETYDLWASSVAALLTPLFSPPGC